MPVEGYHSPITPCNPKSDPLVFQGSKHPSRPVLGLFVHHVADAGQEVAMGLPIDGSAERGLECRIAHEF